MYVYAIAVLLAVYVSVFTSIAQQLEWTRETILTME